MCIHKILIVEDEGITALDLKVQLCALGFEVTEVVATGAQAVASVEKNPPDMVLMDIILKGEMDGIDAAHRIRRRSPVPLIYLTAVADEAIAHRARATGPHAYLRKPFDFTELQSSIERVCSQPC